ncbi:SDR family NAD(P)-dependent oxidoreductase [Gordonia sp. LSe1-13]|uniref:SDR family NAD(P)-dependent oxidoreductase n=1 Tax=Gordonia sesuvii TaxID=3116777 RepID=A0ABU7MJE1_9ACTN|nr:SDR family NAD(P)-dependent oxidoreductase [Gordonia sp. LSe1-13]
MSSRTTMVITGASDGIGAVTARALAGPDIDMVVVGRSADKLEAITADTGATGLIADFSRLDDVRDLAKRVHSRFGHIDLLLNNAGGTFDSETCTADGHEPHFQINHLAPFLLTNLLREQLAAADRGALVLNTSSIGNLIGRVNLSDLDRQRGRGSNTFAYGTSKLMNIMFTRGIAQRWTDDKIYSAAVHPGAVATSFGRGSWVFGLYYRTPLRHLGTITPEQGAEPLITLARRGADPEINGVYFHRHRARGLENPQARHQDVIDGLWSASAELVGLT